MDAALSLNKGGRLAHQTLKAGELVLERPYGEDPVHLRPGLRREYWLGVWEEAVPKTDLTPARIELRARAMQQAQDLPMISSSQLMCTLRGMARKKPGLDAWTVQDLLLMPEPAQASLVYQLRQAELRGMWPVQLQHVAIAMLPKDEVAERPIALTSMLYRCWSRCRQHLLAAWLKATQGITFWDKLIPGSEVEGVSQARQLRAEVSLELGLEHAVVLLDFKHFYDSVCLETLTQRGLELQYPPLLLQLALSVHAAARWILAEDLCSEPVLPGRGLLAGCPQAVALARLFLQPIIERLTKAHPRVFVSTWVDDVGADLEDASVVRLANRTVNFAKALVCGLQDSGLCVSFKKSGVLCSSAALAMAVKKQLRIRCCKPAVCHWLRDLGNTATAGRLRRTAMQQKRWGLAKRRASRLRHLPREVAGRMLRTNILPKAFWGHSHSGLSGKTLQRQRSHLARMSCILKKHGDVEVAFALAFQREHDPAYKLRLQQIQTWIKLFQSTPACRQSLLRKAWLLSWQKLTKLKKPWLSVRGPMAATQMVLFELGWNAQSADCWYDLHGVPCELDYSDSALPVVVAERVLDAVETFLWSKAGSHQASEGLDSRRPDFTVARKRRAWLQKHQPHRVAFHDMVLQGALFTQVDLLHQECACPACGEAADTLRHRLWECPKVGLPVPQDWLQDIYNPVQSCFWLRGLVPSHWTVKVVADKEDLVAEGLFAQTWPISLPVGACICLDGSGGPGQSTTDPRIRRCAWSVVVVAATDAGAFQILGSLVGNLVGAKQSVPRAELTALVKALQATSGDLQLCTDAAYVLKTFRKCRQPSHFPKCHWDLWSLVKLAQRSRCLTLHKIKSHLSESAFQAQYDRELWWMWAGNVRADSLASDRAAALFDSTVVTAQNWLDARTWKVQERLLEAVEWWITRPEFAPRKTLGCKSATKVQWFDKLGTLPLASPHSWKVHKKGLVCELCGLKLAPHLTWEALRPLADSACEGLRYAQATSIVHSSHLLEGRGNGRIFCKLCKRGAPLYKLSGSALLARCKRYRRP